MDRFTVQQLPNKRYCIMRNNEPMAGEFGNYGEAEKAACLREIRAHASKTHIAIDMTDGELLSRLRRLMS